MAINNMLYLELKAERTEETPKYKKCVLASETFIFNFKQVDHAEPLQRSLHSYTLRQEHSKCFAYAESPIYGPF